MLLVLAGLAGVLIGSAQGDGASTTVPARGAFWKLLARDGSLKQVETPTEGLLILPGDSFRLDGVFTSVSLLKTMTLRVQNPGVQSGYLRVHFRNKSVEMYRLVVVPGETVVGTLTYAAEGKAPEILAEASKPGMLPDPSAPFDLRLRLDGPRFVVEINGQELLRARDDRIANGRVVVWADHARLLRANIAGDTMHADGETRTFYNGDRMQAFERERSTGPSPVWRMAGWALVVLLAAAAYLRNLCMGAPPVGLTWRATFAALAPAGALLALRPLVAVPYEGPLLVLAGSLGLLFALFVLRDHVRALWPLGVGGGLRVLLVAGLLVGVAAWVNGDARERALRPLIKSAERAAEGVSEDPFRLTRPMRLDASNALTLPGPYRSLEIDAEVTLAPDSLLEVRLHAEPGLPNGVALFLSTDARWESGFILETKGAFRPLGETFGVLEPERAYRLSVRVVGESYEVELDGRRVCDVDVRVFPSGSMVVMAARGEVGLALLDMRPITPEPPVRDASGEARAAALVPWVLLALLTLAAAVLLVIPFFRALEGA
ncbi:MAG: hypothetical protein ACYTCU_09020, partial [Planctomycetota bacterium]